MPSVIPLRSDLPHFDLQVALTGATFTLTFRWNQREGAWYMDVRTEDGEPIVVGLKCVVDFPIGRRSRDARLPAGLLLFEDTTGRQGDPRWDAELQVGDLGDRVQLLYFEPDEAHLQG